MLQVKAGRTFRCGQRAETEQALMKVDRFPSTAFMRFHPRECERCHMYKIWKDGSAGFTASEVAARSLQHDVPAHFKLRGYDFGSLLQCSGRKGVCFESYPLVAKIERDVKGSGMHREVETALRWPSSDKFARVENCYLEIFDVFPRELYVDEFETQRRGLLPTVMTDVSVESPSSMAGPCIAVSRIPLIPSE